MNYILDIAILAVFSLTVFLMAKNGFVKTILSFTTFIGAYIFTKIFSPFVSGVLYNLLSKEMFDKIKDNITSSGNEYIEKNTSENGILLNLIEKYDVNGVIKSSTDNTIDYLVSGIISLLSKAIAFLGLFIFSLIAIWLLSKLIIVIFKLPLLKQINKTMGFVLGIVLGIFYILLFVGALQLFIPVINSLKPDFITEEIIQKTYIFKYLYNLSWLKLFI